MVNWAKSAVATGLIMLGSGCAVGTVSTRDRFPILREYEHQMPPSTFTTDPTAGRPYCERLNFRYEAPSFEGLDEKLKALVLYGGMAALIRVNYDVRFDLGQREVTRGGKLVNVQALRALLYSADGIGITWGDCPK